MAVEAGDRNALINQLLFSPDSIAGSILILALVIAVGLLIGEIPFAGVRLGIAGVLFSGIIASNLGLAASAHVLEFAREFGLIVFVYSIGLQVGPGILDSLRRDGFSLNLLAAGTVLLGAAIAVLAHVAGGIEAGAAVGIYAGAVTNTPALGSAQQALADAGAPAAQAALPALGYAVAYPFGIIGIILSMLIARKAFRVDVPGEVAAFAGGQKGAEPLAAMSIEVTNANLEGLAIRRLPALSHIKVTLSRVRHGDAVSIATGETALHVGDIVLAVGTRPALEQFRMVIGRESALDVRGLPSALTVRRVVVTNRRAIGGRIEELEFLGRYGVAVTRINRAGVEFEARSGIRLQFGDALLIVGEPADLDRVAAEVGNSAHRLKQPQIALLFLGIAGGIVVGSWPIPVPGLPAPVKLGLAGGPLLVAILMSRLTAVGPLVSYMPPSANLALREVGIALFLACVGLKAGGQFLGVLLGGPGLVWMAWGAAITLAPLLAVAVIGRVFYRVNYVTLCGLLAGAMTDPPALAFASNSFGSDAPSLSYATVYPLTMILRIITAQVLVLALMG